MSLVLAGSHRASDAQRGSSQSQKMQTMPLLVTGLTAGYTTDYGLLMLSVTIMTLPTVILFFTQQKRFVEGVVGSVK